MHFERNCGPQGCSRHRGGSQPILCIPPSPSCCGPLSPVCRQPHCHLHCSHVLTALATLPPAAALTAPQEQGEVEKPSGAIRASSHRSHPLMASSNRDWRQALAMGASSSSGASGGCERVQRWQ
ncbi:hypothetical protein MDA_GLEAN10010991 [Myotis davidii]|uniref:Uncharacterized protein n=1 Tax=Myotis davidii TaxID=225400 RepID=L5LKQ5_MYODS|nr:hypothetical protein MDA_GLEAN10010991 [Myotis davidii]